MTRTLIFATGFALAGALAASTAVFAQENTLDEVKVDAELGDVNGANALEYWPTLTEDLAAAIKAKAGPLNDEGGYDVTVSLKNVSLSGSSLLSGEGEFNHLDGWVYFRPDGDAVPQDQHNIIIDAVTAPTTMPDNTVAVIVPGKPVFYAAMIDGFAAATIDRLKALGNDVGTNDENRQQSN